MKTEMDQLALIAAKGSCETEGLVEPCPPLLQDLLLPPMEFGAAHAFEMRPAATMESLREDLVAARARWAPFLQNTAPALKTGRIVHRIELADWRLEPEVAWELVSLPHYGGPMGRARAWYRMCVTLAHEDLAARSVWVCFGGVDYKAAVFFNGELAGTHEGFFSPFEFDVTSLARAGANEVLVRVDNDAICMGNQMWDDPRCGDKIYGATGLGWDEPGVGWHHCPPGMGIHRPVRVESRPRALVADLFVRPILGEDKAEAWVEVYHSEGSECPVEIEWAVYGANFDGHAVAAGVADTLPDAGPGLNRFRIAIPMAVPRLWSPDTPWMYALQVCLRANGQADRHYTEFGMREFHLDESPDAHGMRGRFMLNGEPIRLRGANTMGHEQQCVLRGDLDQLRDDILLAKLANMNFLRFTQRPVEGEVYRMCDRLGILTQTDLPMFAYLRRNQFTEAVRQSVEMERVVRRHPSAVLVTFINEPFPTAWGDKSHRHLTRAELESFFTAATAALRVENPDRQVKPIDGDYEPPGPGLPDGHCYTAWYNGHSVELGKLHKGYWLPVKPGWNYSCGEYGAEGLDFEEVMRASYPAAWLPDPRKGAADEAAWTPARIHKSQTGSHFHFWFEPGHCMAEWIARSQAHQVWATRLMTEAFRRDNRMISLAIHLFIDAWPAGWMKTIMDCHRNPKPAYFAFREALAPLAVNLRADRNAFWEDECAEIEVWICNDRQELPANATLAYQLADEYGVLASGRFPCIVRPMEAVFQGRVAISCPKVTGCLSRRRFRLQVGLLDQAGNTLHDSEITMDVFRKPLVVSSDEISAYLPADWMVVTDPADLKPALQSAQSGRNVLLLGFPEGTYDVGGSDVEVELCAMQPRHFVARDPDHPVARIFMENDFRFWWDPELNRPSPLLHRLFFAGEEWRGILGTGQLDWGVPATPAFAVAERDFGAGRIIFCELELKGRLANPVAALFLNRLGAWARSPEHHTTGAECPV